MKRIASGPLIRNLYPVTGASNGQPHSDSPNDATQALTNRTIDELRKLPAPPFPPGVDITTCEEVARIARDGIQPETCITRKLQSFCLKHHCSDALVWCLLHDMESEKYERDVYPHMLFDENLKPSEIECLIGCLDRLPMPVVLTIDNPNDPMDHCWDAFLNALTRTRNIVDIDVHECFFSTQKLVQLLSAINNTPTIRELDINIDRNHVDIVNKFLKDNTTLRSLDLLFTDHLGELNSCVPDINEGLLGNRTLTGINLFQWVVTPELVNALAGPRATLTSVGLHNPAFAPEAFAALTSALAHNDTLSFLTFGECEDIVSLEKQKALHDALRFNRTLVSLDLSFLVNAGTHIVSMWEMLQVNLTLREMRHGLHPAPQLVPDYLLYWSLLASVKQRLRENRELPSLADRYPMAKTAFSILPGNLPQLPSEVSAHIAHLLLQADATALPTYRILHMLALHRQIKAQDKPRFPDHLHLAGHLPAQLLAQCGKQALPLPPDVMRSMTLFCIRHKASDALDWLVVHASAGTLDLRGIEFEPGEAGWLIHWTRTAPCHIKLRLDNVLLKKQDIADIAQHMTGNPALTSLSLEGGVMETKELQLICEALKSNTVMVELRLPKNLIAPGRKKNEFSGWTTFLQSRMLTDRNGQVIATPAQASAISLDELAYYRDGIAKKDLWSDMVDCFPPRYLLLAAIAFSLRRNIRLQNRAPTSHVDLLPDQAFVDDIVNSPDLN